MTNTIIPEDLIISMTSAEPLTEQAVRRALAQCGPISSVTPFRSSAVSGQAITAWLVGFVYYADCKETINVNLQAEPYPICLLTMRSSCEAMRRTVWFQLQKNNANTRTQLPLLAPRKGILLWKLTRGLSSWAVSPTVSLRMKFETFSHPSAPLCRAASFPSTC